MDGSNSSNRMIGAKELLARVSNLNNLLAPNVRAAIVAIVYKKYHGTELPFEKRWIEAGLKEGRLLITVSSAADFSTEGIGKWLNVGQLEEDVARDTHLHTATFGLLPTTDRDFRGLVHSSREGRVRFVITSWHEGQRLDSTAEGSYLFLGNTLEDLEDTDT